MRDLPELDSVTWGNGSMYALNVIGWIVVAVLLGALCGAAAILLVRLVLGRWPAIMVCIAISVGFVGLIAAWCTRRNWFDWQWTTDAEGLTIRGLFRTRRVAWSEITEARGDAKSSGKIYVLKTHSTKLVATELHGGGELFGASVYQHLRRFGKADESLLTPGARTFWMPIPREVPDEMDWHNPKPPNWSIAAAVMIAIVIAVPLAYYLGSKIKLHTWWNVLPHNGWLLIAWAYKMLRERLIMARSVAIRHDHIEMRTPRGLVFLPWTDIRYVHWDNSRRTLGLGKAIFTDVAVIPYRPDWPDSAACILAIIRHLRLARHTPPVTIPAQLVPMMYSGEIAPVSAFAKGDAVEFKAGSASLAMTTVLLCTVPGAIIWWLIRDPARMFRTRIPDWIFILPMVFLALGVVIFFVAITTYRADSRGITVSFLGRRKFIDWREVASYVVTPGRRGSRALMDASGRVLLKLPLYERADPSAESFAAYLDARLAPVRRDDLPTLTR